MGSENLQLNKENSYWGEKIPQEKTAVNCYWSRSEFCFESIITDPLVAENFYLPLRINNILASLKFLNKILPPPREFHNFFA